jgi:hypothetical protein
VRGLCRKAPRPAQLRGGRGNPAWPASGSGGAPARCRATHRWGQDLSLAPCLAGASDQQINTVACAWFGEVEEPGRYSSVRPVCRCVRIDSDRKRPRPNSAARQLPQPDAKIVFGEVSSRPSRHSITSSASASTVAGTASSLRTDIVFGKDRWSHRSYARWAIRCSQRGQSMKPACWSWAPFP